MTTTRRRRQPWWHGAVFGVAVAASMLTLLVLIKIGFFDSRSSAPAAAAPHDAPEAAGKADSADNAGDTGDTDAAAAPFRRPSADYILDAGWDANAPPTTRAFHWVIQNIEANPDGVFRTMTTVNGMFPGELIRCNEGDTVVVMVENRAVNATSIHWHGLFQNGTNHMDGTPGATQCPIAPGRSFRYEFQVQGQSGTCMLLVAGHVGQRRIGRLPLTSRLLPRPPRRGRPRRPSRTHRRPRPRRGPTPAAAVRHGPRDPGAGLVP